MLKTNFKLKNEQKKEKLPKKKVNKKTQDLSKEEFEEFISKSGAAGSFMIFRSKNKKDEFGIDNL